MIPLSAASLDPKERVTTSEEEAPSEVCCSSSFFSSLSSPPSETVSPPLTGAAGVAAAAVDADNWTLVGEISSSLNRASSAAVSLTALARVTETCLGLPSLTWWPLWFPLEEGLLLN